MPHHSSQGVTIKHRCAFGGWGQHRLWVIMLAWQLTTWEWKSTTNKYRTRNWHHLNAVKWLVDVLNSPAKHTMVIYWVVGHNQTCTSHICFIGFGFYGMFCSPLHDSSSKPTPSGMVMASAVPHSSPAPRMETNCRLFWGETCDVQLSSVPSPQGFIWKAEPERFLKFLMTISNASHWKT